MSISTIFKSIAMMLLQFWSKIPPEIKDRIIEEILKQFKKILSDYYKNYKEKQSS